MANRRMGGGNFEASYTRRQQGNDGGYANQNFGQGSRQNSFDQSYVRRDANKGDGFYGDNRGGNRGSFVGRDDFNQQQQRGGGGADFTRRNEDWGRDQPFRNDRPQGGGGGGVGNMGMNMRNSNQGQGQGPNQGGGQQVVMVVPQGGGGTGGIMLPVQTTPNPFAMPRQQPMQIVVGNLPAFNSDFGQQILAAASARPQYGQGMMGGAQMGPMNQQQQQQPQQRYDRSVTEGGNRSNSNANRFSRQSNQRPGSGRSATLVRRSDATSGPVNKVARTSVQAATLRGNRKRTILRDRQGGTEEVVGGKRPRPNQNAQVNRAKNAVAKAKANNQKKNNNKKPAEKKAEADNKDEVKKEDDAEVKEEEAMDETTADGEKKPSKYDEFPTALLVCKVCQKVMSDGASFESHVSGRAHASMVKILEQRFQKRTELLMFESKISEEELGIERDRQRRAGKGHGGKNSKNFCKMCDCNYSVNWGTHKGGLAHRILKEYLHPTCRQCTTNFVHRMDWVNHLHSVTHLNKVIELRKEGAEIPEAESTKQDDLFVINVDVGREEKLTNILSIIPADFKIPTKEDLKDMLKEENGELVLPEGEIEIPKEYDENKKYGEDAILNVAGACCKVCKSFIPNVNDIDTHLKSKQHYGAFVGYLKRVVKYRENLKAEAERKAKEEAEKLEKEKKAAEAAAEKAAAEAAAAAAKKEEPSAAAAAETTEASADQKVVVANEAAKSEEVKPEDVEMTDGAEVKAENGAAEGAAVATDAAAVKPESPVKEAAAVAAAAAPSPAKETPKAESPEKEAPKAASPAKTPQGRGGQQGRGRGGRGNARGMSTPRGRGGQTPQRGGSPRGGRGMRGGGGGTPGRGGDSNWRGGGRGGQRGGRGNFR